MTTKPTTGLPGPLHANDSAHEFHAADEAFGVPACWRSAIRNENGDVVAMAEGETAEQAIERAREFARCWNAAGGHDE